MEMFTESSFKVFEVPGLDERMAAIRAEIQPIFQTISEKVVTELTPLLGTELNIHIAQHRRRTANAPDFTWTGIGGDNRGYKKYPHFTLGINGDYIVMWLSFIDNPQFEKEMATSFLGNLELFEKLPADFKVNFDHTVNNYHDLTPETLEKGLVRWRDVKKGEFQVGRIIQKNAEILINPSEAQSYITETYRQLIGLYQLAYQARN